MTDDNSTIKFTVEVADPEQLIDDLVDCHRDELLSRLMIAEASDALDARGVAAAEICRLREQRDEARAEVERLRQVIADLLGSADCEWEIRNLGHDWPLAVAKARDALGWTLDAGDASQLLKGEDPDV